jgi:hypothetical protein
MRNQMAQTRQHGISQLKKNKTEIKCNDESDQPDKTASHQQTERKHNNHKENAGQDTTNCKGNPDAKKKKTSQPMIQKPPVPQSM